jgi:simple sugar transport system ATP-binding protein
MGENGAGKSTLIKCLTGVHRPGAGEIRLDGRPLEFHSARDAEAAGIATVYQEVGLIPHLSVAENICLGREPVRRGRPRLIRWREVHERACAALVRLGIGGLDPGRELGSCSVAVQQLVAIARALDINPRILILDEPTSSLDRDECEQLFGVMRKLRGSGLGIVFITHFLDQVYAVADRITVLREGRIVGVHAAQGLSRAALVSLMVGRALEEPTDRKGPQPARAAGASTQPLLSARGLGRTGVLDHVDLDIAPGEAVGLAGLLGSGRSETASLIFGAERFDRGELRFAGRRRVFRAPLGAIRAGMALTPENRRADGIIPTLSIRENIVLALQARRGLLRRISRREQRRLAGMFIATLRIKTPDADTPIERLSGGNQQKVLLARWFATEPSLLILDEPTRGIDIAAKAEVLSTVEAMRKRGLAILFISSELDEVVRTCSRVVVLRDRRSVAELSGGEVSEPAILQAIARHQAEAARER